MPSYFFTATRNAHLQVTKLFDFVAPTATAMWNLRWQVAGYLSVLPDATKEQLDARFTEGTDIQGANLKRSCIEHSWDEQKEAFGRVVLVNAIAIYEGWIEDILKALGKNTKQFQVALQTPDSSPASATGISWAINSLTTVESSDLRDLFYSPLSKGRNYALPEINAMMLCYRYFKELRNCDMHRGGIADQRLLDAYVSFSAIANPSLLGAKEVPSHLTPSLGFPIKVILRGAIGFTAILFKIIATLDAELCRSEHAVKPFCEKWKATHRSGNKMLPADRGKRSSIVKMKALNAGFPEPTDPNSLGDFLRSLGLSQF